MEVVRIAPRGYCYGVVDAMVIARQAADNPDLPRPIYILGMIVHNRHVTDAFEDLGIVTLDGPNRLEILEQVEKGTVIFTAHGVSPEVRQRAEEKGLVCIDATCPDVTNTHDLILDKVNNGYEVVYIGKKGHPEPEGALGVAPGKVHLVETLADVDALDIGAENIMITNQTTMSQWDTMDLMIKIREKYPHADPHKEICMATQERQEAVAEQAKGNDLVLVVGDPRSNNSNRLAQVSEEIAGVEAHRIADVTEIDPEWLKGKQQIGVTAGASTPTPVTREVIKYLEEFDEHNPDTWQPERTINKKKLLPPVRKKGTERKQARK
ncbi:4-hydroxy-3-methylbut-2-enyl diphosphate reductase [Mechercharimyces sp. CAU 1602]|uniref:4-hydroxy-3-methylbut-2-enyl diphosphate reductase n=1 Tax=Mechercharimyces sp. CAU 1602 TaxID=2973933 RepID=UPI0021625AE3|nr:4-hydroxy-3-methylbut-2-enyl diphosphate reductase [Mechercharimyces sp. CAU 1602]MCS1352173.1 4-hydroxy-3-methylbut-2-enyl diphosphate reductase [Mechercharimyces sp. CAU 1602]